MTDASKAGEARSVSAEGANMMPELPAPYEALLLAYGRSRWYEGFCHEAGSLEANHAAFEAERALRVALLAGLNQGAS